MSNGHDSRPVWEEGWDGHESQQRERISRLPLTEKLRWLEEAHHLALHLSTAIPMSASPAEGIVTPAARRDSESQADAKR